MLGVTIGGFFACSSVDSSLVSVDFFSAPLCWHPLTTPFILSPCLHFHSLSLLPVTCVLFLLIVHTPFVFAFQLAISVFCFASKKTKKQFGFCVVFLFISCVCCVLCVSYQLFRPRQLCAESRLEQIIMWRALWSRLAQSVREVRTQRVPVAPAILLIDDSALVVTCLYSRARSSDFLRPKTLLFAQLRRVVSVLCCTCVEPTNLFLLPYSTALTFSARKQ